MILEAFAQYLQQADPEVPATYMLARWLWERLSCPPESNIDNVLHCEISIAKSYGNGKKSLRLDASAKGPTYVFHGKSVSGVKLLQSLYQYSLSYEQHKWARWVHWLKASDFNERYKGG